MLYAKYDGKGYTRTVTCIRKYDDGTEKVRIVMKWTQKGRAFIYQKMAQAGYAPIIPFSIPDEQEGG